MRDLRRKVARVTITVVTIAIGYVITQLGDPEYVPGIGWVPATFMGILATLWAARYCELPGFPVVYNDKEE
jgi:hypothetical protein